MPMIAAGLARAKLLRTFILPFGGTPGDERSAGPRWIPGSVRARVAHELRRRELPSAINPSSMEHAGSVLEVMAVGAGRMRLFKGVAPSLLRFRDSAFDRAVARRLRPSDEGVFTVAGAAERTLSTAKRLGITSFLECPIAHHRAATRLLSEEAQLQPNYACTLQLRDLPPSLERRLDSEIRLADNVLVLSSYQRQTFLEEGVDPTKLHTVPLGVDTDLFRPGPRPNDSTFRVLFVGQITQRKGISYLVDAFHQARLPRSELVLLGRVVGSDAPWRGQAGLRHIPHVPRWELPTYYHAADVYVLPSLIEGFPLTAAEAMACGLPVLVSEHTFGGDVVDDGANGFVIPIRDTSSIVDRLRYLFENPDKRVEMGVAARATAERFSWELYGARIAAAAIAGDRSGTEAGARRKD